MQDRLRQVSNIVLAVVQLLANALGGAGLLFSNGITVGEISDSFVTYFTPAGYTFAVWGPIYLGLTLYAVYQALPGQASRGIHRRIGWWAVSAAAANTIWTPLFTSAGLFGTATFQPAIVVLSLVVLMWLLASLAVIFVALRGMYADLTTADRWLVEVPFYGYFAWANVATVANATTALIALGWTGTQAGALWSVVAIAAAAVITGGLIFYSSGGVGTGAFLLVMVWALVGVYNGNSEKSMMVGVVALVAAVVLIIVAGFRFMNRQRQTPHQSTPAAA